MPYNPGSAYPRKTVYVPPTYGDTSFQRAVNAPDVSSATSVGGVTLQANGRGAFAGQAASAAKASSHPEAKVGWEAMNRQGLVGKLQANYMERRGLKQNQAAPAHGNTAAIEKRAAASQLADEMVDNVITGDMPGDTGRANTKKSKKKKSDPNQQTLF